MYKKYLNVKNKNNKEGRSKRKSTDGGKKKVKNNLKNGFKQRNKSKIKLKEEIGITLISLIITVIVLLILAGVTINLIIGENGIFKIAENAGKNYMEAQDRELAQIANFTNVLDNILGGRKPRNRR